jgi:hypothetical protein
LIEALQRGVQVIYVVPGQPMRAVVNAGKQAFAWRDGPKDTGNSNLVVTINNSQLLPGIPNFS